MAINLPKVTIKKPEPKKIPLSKELTEAIYSTHGEEIINMLKDNISITAIIETYNSAYKDYRNTLKGRNTVPASAAKYEDKDAVKEATKNGQKININYKEWADKTYAEPKVEEKNGKKVLTAITAPAIDKKALLELFELNGKIKLVEKNGKDKKGNDRKSVTIVVI